MTRKLNPVDKEVAYIALKKWADIGPQRARLMLSQVDRFEDLFSHPISDLQKQLPNIPEKIWNVDRDRLIVEAKADWARCQKENIEVIHWEHPNYPNRFKSLDKPPLALFYQGNAQLNGRRTIGIVGTRKMTERGQVQCEKLVEAIAGYDPLIISGLAYGVDATAHRAALKYGLDTLAMMGTGPDLVYPSAHRDLASKMVEQGGLMTQLNFGKGPEREHFPMRNWLVAAMSDALIVVESAAKGGSMITAGMAANLNKPVFAFPGRPTDEFSLGCNLLIKQQKAQLIESGDDLIDALEWSKLHDKRTVQRQLFVDLTEDEQRILDHLRTARESDVDQLSYQLDIPIHQLSTVLLELEFKGLVKSLPGNRYLAI